MSEEEILKECTELAENEHHELGDCWDEEYSSSAIFGLIMLYKQTKKSEEVLANKLQEVNIELDKTTDLLSICNKRLENISRELEITDEHIYGYDYGEIINKIKQEKEKNKTKVDIKDIEFSNFIKERYVRKDKIKELLENEIIDISGFRCVAVEDIENLLEV